MSGSSWKVATLTSRGVVASGKFFLREKKESRYAETISDRESTCRTAVSPVRQRGKSHCPDDLADGRHRWDAAGRCGSPDEGGGTAADDGNHGRGGAARRGGTLRSEPGAAKQSLGKEQGYCVVDGQKVPIQRARIRTQ